MPDVLIPVLVFLLPIVVAVIWAAIKDERPAHLSPPGSHRIDPDLLPPSSRRRA